MNATVLTSAPVSRVEVLAGPAVDVLAQVIAEPGFDRARSVLALPVGLDATISAANRAVLALYGLAADPDVDAMLAAESVRGSAGQVVRVPVQAPAQLPNRLLLVGVGDGTPAALRRAGAALARHARGQHQCITTAVAGTGAANAQALVEGLVLGGYQTPSAGQRERADGAAASVLTLITDQLPTARSGGVHAGQVAARATVRAREWCEMPAAVKTPQWLAARAAELAAEHGLQVRTWDAQQLREEGFGGLSAVGAGSSAPPCLVRLDYRPVGSTKRPVVLVGKGIVFDTGGISVKPTDSMLAMKTDMSGAAAVLAALLAYAELAGARPVTALLPLAENALGADSYRPSDILRLHGGRTVEVLDTDAEGRLVLADALAYAVRELNPDTIVDVATLTGAATVGLGRRHGALFATGDRLAEALIAAGGRSGEALWRLPLVAEYRSAIDSPVADLRNVPGPHRRSSGGGAITAALFLREFVGDRPWAHLDIAGPARSDRDEYETCRGATGFGARVLLEWLRSLR